MSALRVEPSARGLRGRLRVPGDKSVSHRALLLAALADGTSVVQGLSGGLDVACTARAIEAFGATVRRGEDGVVAVDGGRALLHEPAHVVDVGNSGTAIRLLAGWASGLPGLTVLQGDESIAGRPMGRIVEPLRAMGAHVDGREDGAYPPLAVRGGDLRGIDYTPPVASAQVKGAILLAGLAASGETVVREAIPTRRHSEELLAHFGASVTSGPGWVGVRASGLHATEVDVPADPSQAAFWAVAASIVPGSDLALERVYVGPGRAGFLDVLRRMGADITVEPLDPAGTVADLRVRSAPLTATRVAGAEVPGLIDEIPVLAVAGALAEGVTTFADAGELRVKESDRVATTLAGLAALGVGAEELPDGLSVRGRGGQALAGGEVDSRGDHRIAMAFAVAGLAAADPVTIAGWDAVATSYPGFDEDLRRCVS